MLNRVSLAESQPSNDPVGGLKRKVGQGGREIVEHNRNSHDDLATAICGLLWRLSPRGPQSSSEGWLQFIANQVQRLGNDFDGVSTTSGPSPPAFCYGFFAKPLPE